LPAEAVRERRPPCSAPGQALCGSHQRRVYDRHHAIRGRTRVGRDALL